MVSLTLGLRIFGVTICTYGNCNTDYNSCRVALALPSYFRYIISTCAVISIHTVAFRSAQCFYRSSRVEYFFSSLLHFVSYISTHIVCRTVPMCFRWHIRTLRAPFRDLTSWNAFQVVCIFPMRSLSFVPCASIFAVLRSRPLYLRLHGINYAVVDPGGDFNLRAT